jgi:hypothetical protein
MLYDKRDLGGRGWEGTNPAREKGKEKKQKPKKQINKKPKIRNCRRLIAPAAGRVMFGGKAEILVSYYLHTVQ